MISNYFLVMSVKRLNCCDVWDRGHLEVWGKQQFFIFLFLILHFFEIATTWLFGGKHFFFRLRQDWKIQIKPDLPIASCSKSFVLFHANFLIKDFTGLLHLTNLIERAYFHFLSEDRLLNLTDNNIVFVTVCCRFHKAIIWFIHSFI